MLRAEDLPVGTVLRRLQVPVNYLKTDRGWVTPDIEGRLFEDREFPALDGRKWRVVSAPPGYAPSEEGQ